MTLFDPSPVPAVTAVFELKVCEVGAETDTVGIVAYEAPELVILIAVTLPLETSALATPLEPVSLVMMTVPLVL